MALRHSSPKCTPEALDLYAVLIKVSTTKKQFSPLQFIATSKIGIVHPHHSITLKFKWYHYKRTHYKWYHTHGARTSINVCAIYEKC